MKNGSLGILRSTILGIIMCIGIHLGSAQTTVCPTRPGSTTIEVRSTNSSYRIATPSSGGIFSTGQNASLLLSGIDFNHTGGPLQFNHLGGIASDGTRLAVCDRFNNRVLIWNQLPTANTPPDLVIGQIDFSQNNPGSTRDKLNWPASVRISPTGKLIIVDGYNDRVLIWNSFPTSNGQPADLELRHQNLIWPWGMWTDGVRFAVSSTGRSRVLMWRTFPSIDNQPPDYELSANGLMGTPRTITSNGTYFIVGDHNSNASNGPQGNFVWRSFPLSSTQPFDYFMNDPLDKMAAWLQGDFTTDGKLLMLGRALHVWNLPPATSDQKPTFSITSYTFDGRDGSDLVIAGGKVFVSLYNGNKIVVYNSIPTSAAQPPDFSIGSLDICTNTLDTRYFITNRVPASNGTSLIISSDFDRKMLLWRKIPDESGAIPDLEFFLPFPPWDNAIRGDTLVLAGRRTVSLWKKIPTNGELPDHTYSNTIGGIQLQEIRGVAIDHTYFYLADESANKVYIWEGIPGQSTPPKFILHVDRPQRLSSNGTYLAVTAMHNHAIRLYPLGSLSSGSFVTVSGPGRFNLPMKGSLSHGRLIVDDTGFNRVHVWTRIQDAIEGKEADILLGKSSRSDTRPAIGKNGLFWPGASCFDGSHLWVGEFKFSNRVVRYSPTPPTSVAREVSLPSQIELYQNYANPFNSSTMIRFSVPRIEEIRLEVVDALGVHTAVLSEGAFDAGMHTRLFNASALPSGVYFVRLVTSSRVFAKPMILIR